MSRCVVNVLVLSRHHYVGVLAKETILDATQYRQMAGRAGRAGIDTQGEAILLANNPSLGKQLLGLMQVNCSAVQGTIMVPSIPMSFCTSLT